MNPPTSLEFGLFYFSTGEEASPSSRYRLVLDGARFADANGFASVWLPERHFGAVGSLYPNPAVLHAALARETHRVGLRAGSVVAPLHDPLLVAEDWSLVDNLSGGRVGVAFASGWHPTDFVLAPDNYQERREITLQHIETVRHLWRGGSVKRRGGDGKEVELQIYPRPVQAELPFWLTAAGNPETFERAGRIGAHLLTHMFNQSLEQTKDRIAAYRAGLAAGGFDPASRRVSMMLHTFIGSDRKMVDDAAREPFIEYLRSSSDVLRGIAASKGQTVDFSRLTAKDREELLAFVYERLLDGRVLFGTPESTFDFVRDLWDIGVDEIACQLDFGVPTDKALASLPYLAQLKERAERELPPRSRRHGRPDTAARPADGANGHAPRHPVERSAPAGGGGSLDEIRTRCGTIVPVERFYARLSDSEIDYAGDLRAIRWLARRDGESIAEFACGAAGRALGRAGLLDLAFQALFAAIPGGDGTKALPVPASVESLEVASSEWPEVAWSHASCRSAGDTIVGEVRVLDAAGRVFAHATGIVLKRFSLPEKRTSDLTSWIHTLEWRRSDAVASPSRETVRQSFVVYYCGGDDSARSFAREISEHAEVIEVEIDDYERAAAAIDAALDRSSPDACHVFAPLSVSIADGDECRGAERLLLLSMTITHAVARREFAGRLLFVTRGAQKVSATDVPSATGAAVWGFARVVGTEYPDRWEGVVDLDPHQATRDGATALLTRRAAALVGDGTHETEIAFRGDACYAARLVPRVLEPSVVRAKSDATYVISGGLGGIGLTLAKRLVARGARHLILFGRSGSVATSSVPEPTDPSIEELRSLGATVMTKAADVTVMSELEAIAEAARSGGWPAVKGIVHCAGVWEDKTIAQLDYVAIARVMGPKARGASNLARAFSTEDLDFFVMSSSGAALLAPPAQSNYAAANAFVDAFAMRLRAAKVPATTINWCPWSEVGNAARQGQIESLSRRGIGHVTPEQGANVFEAALAASLEQVVFVPFDWPTWLKWHPEVARSPILRETGARQAVESTAAAAAHFTITRAELDALDPEVRVKRIGDEIARLLAGVLKMDVATLARDAPMPTLGLDSLMAVELKNTVESAFGLSVPIVVLLEGPSVDALATRLAAQFAADPTSRPSVMPEQGERGRAWMRVDRGGDLPLSFAQQRLWFLSTLEASSAAYNIPVAARLRGRLRADLMERALGDVTARHEAMRTTIHTEQGSPVLRIAASLDVTLPVERIVGQTEDERWANGMRAAAELASEPFSLDQAPLWRAKLLALGEDDHVLVFVMHHIVSDGWSVGLVLEQLAQAYAARTHARPLDAPLRDVQYVDYAAWQREALGGNALDQDLAYWREVLAGAPDLLELPTDRPRPPEQRFEGKLITIAADLDLMKQVRDFAAREAVTPFITLLSAFYALLHRYSGQKDLVVGSPTANREEPDSRGVVGFFAQTLALRVQVDETTTFRELTDRVRQSVLGAFAHQNVPFERLVDAIRPPRHMGASPIFQVMFLQNTPLPPVEVPGATVELLPLHSGGAPFDLSFAVTDTPDGIVLQLTYDTALFDASTAERMLAHFLRLLRDGMGRPQSLVGDLELLLPEEHERLSRTWSDVAHTFPDTGKSVVDLFHAQVEKTPDAPAIEFEGRRLSYAGLDVRASQLAHHLRSAGVGSESLVALVLSRSLEMVVSFLAVLKAGGAWLPIDPDAPASRVRFMIDDAKANMALTSPRYRGLVESSGSKAVVVDIEDWAFGDRPRRPPSIVIHPHHPAYCIYTSGSTGRPKGVINSHRGLVNCLLWMQEALPLTGSDVVIQKTPYSFDVSVCEVFSPLIVGARLVVCRPGDHRDPRALAETMTSHGVTSAHFVPSMLQAFVDEPKARDVRTLRRVICIGEALSRPLSRRFFELFPATELENLYGPAEAAIVVSRSRCRSDDDRASVPIGTPIPNNQLFVLDRSLGLCPVGVLGELYIGGVHLARGYLFRPDLTADRFVPNPFGSPGSRLYRTGDVCRWLPDGTLDYVGRTDFQVKLRGFRIELGEIEHALSGVSGVRHAVVVSRDDGRGQELVAYVVSEPGLTLTAATLRRDLASSLAEYMVPAHFVFLSSLPLNTSGKIDRKALPAPEIKTGERSAPSDDPIVVALCEIATSLFRIDSLGIDDNFFDLGANSLLAVRFVARAREQFNVELALKDLFNTPNIASLSALVKERMSQRTGETPANEPALRRIRRGPPR